MPEKDDITKAQGIRGYLIPEEALPSKLKWLRVNSYVKLELLGEVTEIEGERFLKVEKWKLL